MPDAHRIDFPQSSGPQVIPRPPNARLGGPAPWFNVDPKERCAISIEDVRRAIQKREPGAVEPAVVLDGLPDPGAPAAVLVAIFEEDGQARVVLTRRAAHMRTHTGEVSFPGGKLDAMETAEEAALREAHEEIGLAVLENEVEIAGYLTRLSTFSSRTTITPVVALLDKRPDVVVNLQEVEHAFDVSLAELADDAVFREELWQIPGRFVSPGGNPTGEGWFPVWFFELPDDTIWGATARILVELLRLVLAV